MKNWNVILVLVAILLSSCGSRTANEEDGIIEIDVTKGFPKKELILQEIFDVEYVALETSNEFLTQGKVMDVGRRYITVANQRDGELMIYDRSSGRGIAKFNHKGEGPNEYILPMNVFLDEESGELIVNDGPRETILIYDMEGNFKRSFTSKPGALLTNMFRYDKNFLICEDTYVPENPNASQNSFFLMSLADGAVTNIQIPYENRVSTMIVKQVGEFVYSSSPDNSLILPCEAGWLLMEPSSDTIYSYRNGGELLPVAARTPSVTTMEPPVFLFAGSQTGQYSFLQTVERSYDFEKREGMKTRYLVYDKQSGAINEVVVINRDFKDREENVYARAINPEISFCVPLDPPTLLEANKDGKLSGRLKEIADGLDEEDNPVIMIVKHK